MDHDPCASNVEYAQMVLVQVDIELEKLECVDFDEKQVKLFQRVRI